MQGFLTPRSQVWAARMGESLQEYSSPSCDLDFINDRLRAPRPTTPLYRGTRQGSAASTPAARPHRLMAHTAHVHLFKRACGDMCCRQELAVLVLALLEVC